MQVYKVILPVLYTVLLGFFVSPTLKAQSALAEGTLVYKADTINRLEAFPAVYIVSQLVVYKKLDQLRIEVWRVNKFNKADTQKDIYIRNKKGVFHSSEPSDPMMAASANFALFMTYEEERRQQAERIMLGLTSNYKVDKVIESTKWLGLPAQRVMLKGGPKNQLSEVVLTRILDIPIGSVFDSLLGVLPGTPLEFIIQERGWLTRLTAVKLQPKEVSDTLFELDPRLKIMSFDEMLQGISDFK